MAGYNLKDLVVLIVDDSQHMRILTRTMLLSLGLRSKNVFDVDSAPKAYEFLKNQDVDIIICDWLMKPVSGIDFIKKLRQFPPDGKPNPFQPVILLTGNSELESVLIAREAGINEFLAKPIAPKDLYLRIKSIIENPRLFIRTATYVGPDRRRQDVPIDFPDRRKKKE